MCKACPGMRTRETGIALAKGPVDGTGDEVGWQPGGSAAVPARFIGMLQAVVRRTVLLRIFRGTAQGHDHEPRGDRKLRSAGGSAVQGRNIAEAGRTLG